MTPDVDAPPASRRRKTSGPRHELVQPIVKEIDQDVIEELGYHPRSGVMSADQLFHTERGLLYNTPLGTGRLNHTGDHCVPPHARGPHTIPLEQEWRRFSAGLDDPGTPLVRALSRREGSAASEIVRSRSRSLTACDDAQAQLALYDKVFNNISTAIDDFDEFNA